MDEQTHDAPRGRLDRLFAPVDGASMGLFRIAFGLIMLWEVWRFLSKGWVDRHYVRPDFHFTYLGFSWVTPWPGDGMHWHFYALGLLAVLITLGLAYRVACALFFLGFSYVFLLEQARYLNHFYLVVLVSFVMIFVPANRSLSLDARLRPALRADTVPRWSLWLLRSPMGFAYFFGGIAKINGDWLRGHPMRDWLASRSDFPILGPLFEEPWMAIFMSHAGLLIDLLCVPLLLWRKTRTGMFVILVTFHLTNHELFNIGIFPFMSIVASTLFFDPSWPRRIFNWPRHGDTAGADGKLPCAPRRRVALGLLCAWFLLQTLVPLRHHLYSGNVAWTEEGHRFSWRMKLRDKSARARFLLRDRLTGRVRTVNPSRMLEGWQARKMANRPYMILQFAHHLAARERRKGRDVGVHAVVNCSLNGRQPEALIDPEIDLTTRERVFFATHDFILPLTGELPDG